MAIEKLKFLVTADTKNFALGMKAVAALATAAFAAAIKVSADFEKQLSKLRAVSGATTIEMGELETQARKLGKTTAFTAVEVASLQVELAKLGFTSKQILQSSGGILDLAAGLGVELSDAAKLTGTSIRAFGLAAEDTGRVVDVLAHAAASSALDFTTLTEGLKDAAPIAKLYNFTIEDTVSLLGLLANAGIKGSKAGVGLRQIFLELDKKGVKFADALNQVNSAANPAATAMDLVGKRAAGALAIIAENEGAVNGLADELYNAEGAANKMRLIMEDNLIGDFDKLKSAVTEMGLQLGETTEGPLRDFVQWMTDVINGSETTLGFIDSLARVFLFLEESALLAFKVVEEIWITIQTIATSNPLTGKMGIASPESFKRLALIKKRLEEINGEIIKISGGYGTGSSTSSVSSTSSNRKTPKRTSNTVGGGSGGGSSSSSTSGTAGYLISDELITAMNNTGETALGLQGIFTSLADSISQAFSGDITGKGLLASLLSVLGDVAIQVGIAAITIGTTIEAIRTALMSFLGVGAIAAGAILIGTGIALKAGAAALGSASSKAGVSSPVSQSTPSSTSVTPSSLQGNGSVGRLVGEFTVRGQDLRLALQTANDSYTALS